MFSRSSAKGIIYALNFRRTNGRPKDKLPVFTMYIYEARVSVELAGTLRGPTSLNPNLSVME
ncbi:hypothetical protein N7450_004437 [Penicillium hetheringtonii]|uniref:Uncharacterized protein n=1 Tax=Penicillium hetheringtonii TaxID=911720 RepID=A0AAD6DQ07_9EURO|nr:hypothetical protein N7450_004437 [Penicillium hetheringtonii]